MQIKDYIKNLSTSKKLEDKEGKGLFRIVAHTRKEIAFIYVDFEEYTIKTLQCFFATKESYCNTYRIGSGSVYAINVDGLSGALKVSIDLIDNCNSYRKDILDYLEDNTNLYIEGAY